MTVVCKYMSIFEAAARLAEGQFLREETTLDKEKSLKCRM